MRLFKPKPKIQLITETILNHHILGNIDNLSDLESIKKREFDARFKQLLNLYFKQEFTAALEECQIMKSLYSKNEKVLYLEAISKLSLNYLTESLSDIEMLLANSEKLSFVYNYTLVHILLNGIESSAKQLFELKIKIIDSFAKFHNKADSYYALSGFYAMIDEFDISCKYLIKSLKLDYSLSPWYTNDLAFSKWREKDAFKIVLGEHGIDSYTESEEKAKLRDFYNQKKYLDALEYHEKITANNPVLKELLRNYKGLILMELGEYSKAIKEFSAHPDWNQNLVSVYNHTIACVFEKGIDHAKKELYQLEMAIFENYSEEESYKFYYCLSGMFAIQGNHKKCNLLLQQASSLNSRVFEMAKNDLAFREVLSNS